MNDVITSMCLSGCKSSYGALKGNFGFQVNKAVKNYANINLATLGVSDLGPNL